MFARVSTFQVSPDAVDESIERDRTTTVPAALELDGIKGLLFMVDRATGKMMAITLWESEGTEPDNDSETLPFRY